MSSLKKPNEVITAYVKAIHESERAQNQARLAAEVFSGALQARQAAWREVLRLVNDGTIEEGVYQVRENPRTVLLIERHHDYPDLHALLDISHEEDQ